MCDSLVVVLLISQIFKLFEPAYNSLRTSYRSVVASKLTPFGLRFDDMLDPLKDEVRVSAARVTLPQPESWVTSSSFAYQYKYASQVWRASRFARGPAPFGLAGCGGGSAPPAP